MLILHFTCSILHLTFSIFPQKVYNFELKELEKDFKKILKKGLTFRPLSAILRL